MSHRRAHANAERRESLARSVVCPKCEVPVGAGCVKLTGGKRAPIPCAKAHAERLAAALATFAAAARRPATSENVVVGLDQLARRVTRLMLSLERAVHAVRKASHAGRCAACSGGEVWTDEPHPESAPEAGERVLGRCPVCNGHADLDCDVPDCRTC